jgi:transcriptional regulatory protein RtcR
MSALFGHKMGTFTGAIHNKKGLLRAADNGMLFLDEVGELGLDEQSIRMRAHKKGRRFKLFFKRRPIHFSGFPQVS